MGKKRKATSRAQEVQAPVELDSRDSRKRIKTFEDVAGSDDEFHLNQDEVRLGEDTASKPRRKLAEQEEFLEQSDEEVLGYSNEEEEEEDGLDAGPAQIESDGSDDGNNPRSEDEDQATGWGTSRADLYGADAIETEEQALEEEAEAIRLQKKQLESMRAADYGFDEAEWQQSAAKEAASEDAPDAAVVTEILPQLQIAPGLSPAERVKILRSRYPEFEPLRKDLLQVGQELERLQAATQPSVVTLAKLRAVSAYMGALVMYFSLLTSTASHGERETTALAASQLRDHPVMDTLVSCRQVWIKMAALPAARLPRSVQAAVTANGDLDAKEVSSLDDNLVEPDQAIRKPRLSRAERHAEATRVAAEARRAERMRNTEAELADLDQLVAPATGKKASKAQRTNASLVAADDSDLGEEAALTTREAEEKAKRKKSLRFYTSQIAQKVNKRGTAGRNAGGDDDIPHRERLRDRQTRLNAEAEKRGKRNDAGAGAELGGESDEEDHRQAAQIRVGAADDEYYDLVAARTAKKKDQKAALAETQRQAALQGGRVVQEEIVGADGKRKISYLIEKNKGLTPHRKKDVRNPRVKKRKKYDEKKKKLASIKPVYKGGEGRGGYGGELTGIKKGLVKSTKL